MNPPFNRPQLSHQALARKTALLIQTTVTLIQSKHFVTSIIIYLTEA
ncbi:hypothetical protein PRUB_a3782 [Pseudoalteromonas rubra]|uniref:Uncharacterized protein n=1 Tax=Pseudoalteromonas rubra TaxID=43658 RepID=A0A8T0C853_9GAMM|nr:hypothetical protein PRUB_a3782 [Pseudoalteromonas rubra]